MELEALHIGVIKLDVYDIPCYVLNNEMRVLSQREVVKLITGGRESGNLSRYLEARALQPYLPDKLKREAHHNPLVFKVGTTFAHALEASEVVDICNAYLKARQSGTLQPNQAKLAEQAEMFISACAKTGIDAIIDEATGYQYFRKAESLQEKFQAYLQDEYREWTLTFPRQFFMQLYKLEGIVPPMNNQAYPKRFGKYVMQFVYDTLDPDIADYLRKNNPDPSGIKHHHQLFNDFGYKSLQDHLIEVLGIMKASIRMDRFRENIATAFPNAKTKKFIRLEENRKKQQVAPPDPLKGTLFEGMNFGYLPSLNTPSKEEREADTQPENVPRNDFDKALKGLLSVPPPPKSKK
jgi:hypothetical protein